MYICTHIYIYIHMYIVLTHTCSFICVYVGRCRFFQTHFYTYFRCMIYICLYIFIHIYIHIYIYIYVCICIYTHIYIYICIRVLERCSKCMWTHASKVQQKHTKTTQDTADTQNKAQKRQEPDFARTFLKKIARTFLKNKITLFNEDLCRAYGLCSCRTAWRMELMSTKWRAVTTMLWLHVHVLIYVYM